MVDRNLRFAEYLGIKRVMSFELNLDLTKGVKNNHGNSIRTPKKSITLILGAGRPAKKWTIEGYKAVSEFMLNKSYTPILIGSSQEYKEAKTIEKIGGINLVRENGFYMDLENLARLLANSKIVIGGDTGLTHLADAIGVKVIGLYGPTRPSKFAPYNNKDLVISTNDTTKRMTDINPKEVTEKLEKILTH